MAININGYQDNEVLRSKTASIDRTKTFMVNPYDDEGNWVGLRYGDLQWFVGHHQGEMQSHYEKLYRYYRGQHDAILGKRKKAEFKPDNRIVMNYSKKIVKSFVGYAASIPPTIDIIAENGESSANSSLDAIDTRVKQFNDLNSIGKLVATEVKYASIYGRGLALVYEDEQSQVRVAALDPTEGFIIYSSDVSKKPLFGVHYVYLDDDAYVYADIYAYKQIEVNGELVQVNQFAERVRIANDLDYDTPIEFLDKTIGYGGLPMIEFFNDEERMGLYEDVLSIIDALDDSISEKANDVAYFGDAILMVVNANLDIGRQLAPTGTVASSIAQPGLQAPYALARAVDESRNDLRDKKILNLKGQPDLPVNAAFLEKPSADGTQENLINRLLIALYDITGIVNLNDRDFANAASGVALKNRLQSMRELADTTASNFKTSLISIISCYLTHQQLGDYVSNVRIKFKRNEPIDLLDISTAMVNLSNVVAGGFVSLDTALTNIPFIDDADQEIQKILNERKGPIKEIQDAIEEQTARPEKETPGSPHPSDVGD